jgi:hypothetical protein
MTANRSTHRSFSACSLKQVSHRSSCRREHPTRIGTHLDSFSSAIREAQGGELRAGPANTSLPVIVAMDSNSQAFPLPQDATYLDFISAGYSDVWTEVFPSLPGFTCCQNETDNNPVSELSQRIDLILTKSSMSPLGIALLGADSHSRLPDGLWPSDHAGCGCYRPKVNARVR